MDVHRSSASDHPRALSDLKDARFFGNSKAMWVTGGERLCLYEDAYLKEQSRLTHRYSPEHSCPVPTKPGRQAQLNELPPWWIHRACPSGAQVWLPSRQGLEGGAITEKKKMKVSQVLKCVCMSLSFHSPTQRLISAAHLRILRNVGVSESQSWQESYLPISRFICILELKHVSVSVSVCLCLKY